MILKRTFFMFTLILSNASISNWNETESILCVSKIDLYLSTGFLSMSIDNWRYDRWSCCFEEMKVKHVMSVIKQLMFKNNSLSYFDWWGCAHCFLKGCNVMYGKEHKLRDQVRSKNEENSNKQTMHLIFSSSFFSPFLLSLLPFSLLTHIQQKRTSDKWCIHLDS